MKYVLVLFSLILFSCGTGRHSGLDNALAPSNKYSERSYSEETIRIVPQNSNITQSSDISYNQLDKKPYDDHDKPVEGKKERLLTYYYSFDIETKDFDKSHEIIEEIIKTNDGYISNSSNFYIEFKIPTAKSEFVISQLDRVGKVTKSNKSASDITLEYYDVELRLENMYKSRERYLELLKQAEDVETTLKVEKELERLLYEIESLKGRLNTLKNMVNYSTITIHLKEKTTPGPVGWVFYGLYHGVKWLFVWD